VNYMMAKDSVKSRLQSEEGISYTEFTYMLLQAYDFLHLFDNDGCRLQAGGSDQWGNITAGIELIRRMRGERAYGLAYPLVTTADGAKLGKTESGTIWLGAERTSPYRFYQFWLNQSDAVVIDYLRYFTWLSQPEIGELEHSLSTHPERRDSQRKLAQELTQMVHGDSDLNKAERASAVLFGGEIVGLDADDIQEIFADVPSSVVPTSSFEGEGMSVIELFAETGAVKSRGEARRLIASGGAYVNNLRVTDEAQTVAREGVIDGRFVILRRGKKAYHLVRIQ
jgi:tyrosyl-tRNA synthetase